MGSRSAELRSDVRKCSMSNFGMLTFAFNIVLLWFTCCEIYAWMPRSVNVQLQFTIYNSMNTNNFFFGILRIRMFQLNIPAIHCVNLFPGISKTRKCPKLIVECIHDSHNMSDLGRRQRLIEHIVKWSFAAKSDFKFGQIRSPPHVCPIKKQSVWNLSILALCVVMQFCNCCIWKETMT